MKKQLRFQLRLYALLFGLISLNGYGQVQIGEDIIGFHHLGLGETTSLSKDGNTVAIGCWGANTYNPNDPFGLYLNGIYGNNGSVRVYTKKVYNYGVVWEQLGDYIFPEPLLERRSPGQRSGRAVQLSDDGSVLAIGTRGYYSDFYGTGLQDTGHVRVFKKTKDDPSPGGYKWEQVGNTINGTQAGGLSGFDVSLSGDGTTVAIGAPFFDADGLSDAGQVRVFKRDSRDNWVQLGSDIEGKSAGERLGVSVNLSDDGRTLAMTALHLGPGYRDENQIYVYDSKGFTTKVYQNVNGDWVLIGDFMGDEGVVRSDESGAYVRLTGDGNALAITSWIDRSVQVYERDAEDNWNWTLKGDVLKGGFGFGIALSDDANTLAVGSPVKDSDKFLDLGAVRIYKYRPNNNTWQAVGRFNGEHKGHELGNNNSLSLSTDGSVLAMGASDYGFEIRGGLGWSLIWGRARMFNIGVGGVSIQRAPAAVNTTDSFEVTFKFDRGVIEFNEQDIVVTNATVSKFTAVDASEYTAEVTPMSICGDDDDITINVRAGSAFDIDSNMSSLAAQEVVVKTGVVAVAKDITVQLAPNGLVTIPPGDVDNGSAHNCENGDAVTLSLDRDTFDCSDVGTPVTVTLTAASGNQTDSTTAVVTVEDHTSGLVAVAKDITVKLDADGTASINPEQVNNGSGSGCNGTGTISLSLDKSVFTCEDVGIATVVLKVGQGGETATATATVTVEEDLDNLVAIAKDITVQLDNNGQAIISPDMVDNGSTYGCGNTPELSLDMTTFDCGDVGAPVMVVLTAAQGDNSETTTALVTVEEHLGNLVANAKDITVRLDNNGQATISPGDVDNGSTYGCGSIPELGLDRDTFTCDDVRAPVTVTLTAAQGSETATATALVTVEATGHCGVRLADFNNGFSPNGDGIGDTFVIEGLEKYGNNVVRIYDLGQRLLFSAHYGGPGDAWDGTHKGGRMVPVGSYVCVIDYNEPGLGHEAKMIYVNY